MTTMPYPEPEGPIKAWLRSTGITGKRVFIGPPSKPVYPHMIVYRVGGGPIPGPVPVYQPLMRIEIWGDPARRGKDRYEVSQLGTDLVTAIQSIHGGTVISPGVRLDDGHVQSGPLWHPGVDDSQEEHSCVVLTAEFLMRAIRVA